MNPAAHEATDAAFALTETLVWLCSIPSPTGEEAELCRALEQRLSGAGARLVRNPPRRPPRRPLP